jgi:hypothetical protein
LISRRAFDDKGLEDEARARGREKRKQKHNKMDAAALASMILPIIVRKQLEI